MRSNLSLKVNLNSTKATFKYHSDIICISSSVKFVDHNLVEIIRSPKQV